MGSPVEEIGRQGAEKQYQVTINQSMKEQTIPSALVIGCPQKPSGNMPIAQAQPPPFTTEASAPKVVLNRTRSGSVGTVGIRPAARVLWGEVAERMGAL